MLPTLIIGSVRPKKKNLMVCLVGWILGKMEKKNWEKIGEETFLMSVWLKGEEGKKPTRPEYFLSKLTKMFYSQIGEKIRKNINGLHHPRAAVLLLIVNGVLLLFSFFLLFLLLISKRVLLVFFFFFFLVLSFSVQLLLLF